MTAGFTRFTRSFLKNKLGTDDPRSVDGSGASLNHYSFTNISNKVIKMVNGNISGNKHLKLLKLAHLNTRGGLKGNKFDELGVVLDKHKPHILGTSEINHDVRDDLQTGKLNYNFHK